MNGVSALRKSCRLPTRGSVVKHGSGKRSTYIPRKAFMDYMNNYYRAPSDKLIAAVVEEITKRKTIE